MDNKELLTDILVRVKKGNPPKMTHYMKHKLIDEGLVKAEVIPMDKRGRGRPKQKLVVIGRGKQMVTWAEKREEKQRASAKSSKTQTPKEHA